MANIRQRVKLRILSAIKRMFPQLRFTGRAPGYRYCFSQVVKSEPLNIHKHLVIRHVRKQKQLRGHWAYSLFPRFRREGSEIGFTTFGGEFTHKNPLREELFEFLTELRAWDLSFGPERLKEQEKDERVHPTLWAVYKKLIVPSGIAELELRLCHELVRTEDFVMAEPRSLRVGAFVDDLASQGDVVSEESTFSLEASRARRKLADFQLTNPQEFLVHLIAGGIAGGADQVTVYVDSDDIVVRFDGKPVSRVEMEQLFANLLSGNASARSQELAVALNAASSLQPRFVRLDSEAGWRLEVRAQEETVTELPDDVELNGHEVHFRDKPSLKVLKRFVNSLRADHPERDIVRERCALAPVPIVLDGDGDCRRLPRNALTYLIWRHPDHKLPEFDLSEADGLEESSPVDASIVVILGPEPAFHCVVSGLTYPPPQDVNPRSTWCLLVDDKARRDLSFSSVLQDKRWDQNSEAIGKAWQRLVDYTYDHHKRLMEMPWQHWMPHFQALVCEGDRRFRDVPAFKRVAGELASRSDILNEQRILFADRDYPHGLRSGENVYILADSVLPFFGGRRMKEVSAELVSSQVYFKRLEQWMAKPQVDVAEIMPQKFDVGESTFFGLHPSTHSISQIHFYSQGRFLAKSLLPGLAPGIKVVINDDRLQMNDHWTMLQEDIVHRKAVRRVRQKAHDFWMEVLKKWEPAPDHTLRYLLHLKELGQNWEKHANYLRLPTLTGDVITLQQYLQDMTLSRTMLKDAIDKMTVAPAYVRLIRKLRSD